MHKTLYDTEATKAAQAIARRVTISLASKSPEFARIAGEEGVKAIQQAKANGGKLVGLKRKHLLLVEDALAKVEDVLPKEFVFMRRARDVREASGVCDLCGEQHLRFLFTLHTKDGAVAFESVGSSCIYTYLWNAMGAATSDEAKKELNKLISSMIQKATAEEFAKENPDFEQELTDLHSRYRRIATSIGRYNKDVLKRTREVAKVVGYFFDIKQKHGVGMVTETRLEQVRGPWLVYISGWEQRYADQTRAAEERARNEVERDQSAFRNLLTVKGSVLLSYERKIVENWVARNARIADLSRYEVRLFDVLNRRQPNSLPDFDSLEINMDEVFTILKEAGERISSASSFCASLRYDLTNAGYLTPNQLAAVIGDKNGMNTNGRPSLKTQLEALPTAVAA